MSWERLRVPDEANGSCGAFCAPKAICTLDSNNGYEVVQAWLTLHESMATQQSYRKKAERLILRAIVERGRPLSLLTTDCQAVRRMAGRGSADQGSFAVRTAIIFPKSRRRLLLANAFANDLREEIRLSNSPGAQALLVTHPASTVSQVPNVVISNRDALLFSQLPSRRQPPNNSGHLVPQTLFQDRPPRH